MSQSIHLNSAINSVNDLIDLLKRTSESDSDSKSKSRPDELFHFTDAEGVVGILQSKELWASLATAFNDRSEIAYGIELARTVIENKRRSDARGQFQELVVKFLDPSNSPSNLWVDIYPFVVSLCARPDQAIHWLHYGRSGTGIALGFDSYDIQKAKAVLYPADHAVLYPVLYLPEEQERLITSIVETAFEFYSQCTADIGEIFKEHAAHITATFIRIAAPRFKSPAFEAEQEWRLITTIPKHERITANTDMPFRAISGRVVPYNKLKFESLPLTQIILGASAPILPTDQALKILIEETVGRSIPISKSPVQLRP